MDQMAQRPARRRGRRRRFPFHKLGGHTGSGESRAGAVAVSTHMAEAEAADTCSQAFMTPFPSSLPLPC